MRLSFAASALAVATFAVSALVGCASSTDTTEDADAANDALTAGAREACSPTAYAAGLAHYKKAVAAAKERSLHGACESATLDGTESNIASEAAAAVKSCASFQSVLAQSQWAAPVRTELAGNLALPYLTGALDPATFSGFAAALPGKTVWGPAPGVYGHMSKIAFAANGKATLSKLDIDGAEPKWVDTAATWSAIVTGGKASVKLVTPNETSTYYVKLRDDAPDFVFTNVEQESDTFTSLQSECDA